MDLNNQSAGWRKSALVHKTREDRESAVFLEAAKVHESFVDCFAVQRTFPFCHKKSLFEGLSVLRCDACWREIFKISDRRNAQGRALVTRYYLRCTEHARNITPACSHCAVAFYGYKFLHEQIITGIHEVYARTFTDSILAMRFAFLGACFSCDNDAALCIYLHITNLLLKSAISRNIGSCNVVVLVLLQDCLRSLSANVSRTAEQILAFMGRCFFPDSRGICGKKIWDELEFTSFLREDVARYIEAQKWKPLI